MINIILVIIKLRRGTISHCQISALKSSLETNTEKIQGTVIYKYILYIC